MGKGASQLSLCLTLTLPCWYFLFIMECDFRQQDKTIQLDFRANRIPIALDPPTKHSSYLGSVSCDSLCVILILLFTLHIYEMRRNTTTQNGLG